MKLTFEKNGLDFALLKEQLGGDSQQKQIVKKKLISKLNQLRSEWKALILPYKNEKEQEKLLKDPVKRNEYLDKLEKLAGEQGTITKAIKEYEQGGRLSQIFPYGAKNDDLYDVVKALYHEMANFWKPTGANNKKGFQKLAQEANMACIIRKLKQSGDEKVLNAYMPVDSKTQKRTFVGGRQFYFKLEDASVDVAARYKAKEIREECTDEYNNDPGAFLRSFAKVAKYILPNEEDQKRLDAIFNSNSNFWTYMLPEAVQVAGQWKMVALQTFGYGMGAVPLYRGLKQASRKHTKAMAKGVKNIAQSGKYGVELKKSLEELFEASYKNTRRVHLRGKVGLKKGFLGMGPKTKEGLKKKFVEETSETILNSMKDAAKNNLSKPALEKIVAQQTTKGLAKVGIRYGVKAIPIIGTIVEIGFFLVDYCSGFGNVTKGSTWTECMDATWNGMSSGGHDYFKLEKAKEEYWEVEKFNHKRKTYPVSQWDKWPFTVQYSWCAENEKEYPTIKNKFTGKLQRVSGPNCSSILSQNQEERKKEDLDSVSRRAKQLTTATGKGINLQNMPGGETGVLKHAKALASLPRLPWEPMVIRYAIKRNAVANDFILLDIMDFYEAQPSKARKLGLNRFFSDVGGFKNLEDKVLGDQKLAPIVRNKATIRGELHKIFNNRKVATTVAKDYNRNLDKKYEIGTFYAGNKWSGVSGTYSDELETLLKGARGFPVVFEFDGNEDSTIEDKLDIDGLMSFIEATISAMARKYPLLGSLRSASMMKFVKRVGSTSGASGFEYSANDIVIENLNKNGANYNMQNYDELLLEQKIFNIINEEINQEVNNLLLEVNLASVFGSKASGIVAKAGTVLYNAKSLASLSRSAKTKLNSRIMNAVIDANGKPAANLADELAEKALFPGVPRNDQVLFSISLGSRDIQKAINTYTSAFKTASKKASSKLGSETPSPSPKPKPGEGPNLGPRSGDGDAIAPPIDPKYRQPGQMASGDYAIAIRKTDDIAVVMPAVQKVNAQVDEANNFGKPLALGYDGPASVVNKASTWQELTGPALKAVMDALRPLLSGAWQRIKALGKWLKSWTVSPVMKKWNEFSAKYPTKAAKVGAAIGGIVKAIIYLITQTLKLLYALIKGFWGKVKSFKANRAQKKEIARINAIGKGLEDMADRLNATSARLQAIADRPVPEIVRVAAPEVSNVSKPMSEIEELVNRLTKETGIDPDSVKLVNPKVQQQAADVADELAESGVQGAKATPGGGVSGSLNGNQIHFAPNIVQVAGGSSDEAVALAKDALKLANKVVDGAPGGGVGKTIPVDDAGKVAAVVDEVGDKVTAAAVKVKKSGKWKTIFIVAAAGSIAYWKKGLIASFICKYVPEVIRPDSLDCTAYAAADPSQIPGAVPGGGGGGTGGTGTGGTGGSGGAGGSGGSGGAGNCIDGGCGDNTRQAIKEFQSAAKIRRDGWIGGETGRELAKLVKPPQGRKTNIRNCRWVIKKGSRAANRMSVKWSNQDYSKLEAAGIEGIQQALFNYDSAKNGPVARALCGGKIPAAATAPGAAAGAPGAAAGAPGAPGGASGTDKKSLLEKAASKTNFAGARKCLKSGKKPKVILEFKIEKDQAKDWKAEASLAIADVRSAENNILTYYRNKKVIPDDLDLEVLRYWLYSGSLEKDGVKLANKDRSWVQQRIGTPEKPINNVFGKRADGPLTMVDPPGWDPANIDTEQEKLNKALATVSNWNIGSDRIRTASRRASGGVRGGGGAGEIVLFKVSVKLLNPINGQPFAGTDTVMHFDKRTDFPVDERNNRGLSLERLDYRLFALMLDNIESGIRRIAAPAGFLSSNATSSGQLDTWATKVNESCGVPALYNREDFFSSNLKVSSRSSGLSANRFDKWPVARRILGLGNFDRCSSLEIPENVGVQGAEGFGDFEPAEAGSSAGGEPKSKTKAGARAKVSEGKPSWCPKARTVSEKTICGNAELSKLDIQNENLAKQLRSQGKRAPRWVRDRDKCGNDVNCLKQKYKARIASLKKMLGGKQ